MAGLEALIGSLLPLAALVLALLALLFWWLALARRGTPTLSRFAQNPLLSADPAHWWESQAVFNPAAVVHDGKVHLFYRALGPDGVSRVGYAVSGDGIHFERLPYPVFEADDALDLPTHHPYTSPALLRYDRNYASGGGWGGCEDPRAVVIDDRLYLTFNMLLNGWVMRVAYSSLSTEDLSLRQWLWHKPVYLSRGNRQKNWVLFPEKINGKYALFCNLDKGDPHRVYVVYVDQLDTSQTPSPEEAPDPQLLPDHHVAWHHHTRSAAAPPLKTPKGWLLFYHASSPDEPHIGYKLGAMLLDLEDPSCVIARAQQPVLEPTAWYENDWKPGVVYATGAVVLGRDLIVYYGGGDKYIAAAKINLEELLRQLKREEPAV